MHWSTINSEPITNNLDERVERSCRASNTTYRRITTLRHEFNVLGKPVRHDVSSQAFGKQMNLK